MSDNARKPLPSFVKVERSARKTVRLSVTRELTVRMQVPRSMSDERIASIYYEREGWVAEHYERMRQRAESRLPVLSEAQLRRCADQTRSALLPILAHYAARLGVHYGRISIRRQKSRYGSCSSRRNLNFNLLLCLMPRPVLEYVAVHELCHLKHMNHSSAFWAEVERVLPSYRDARAWLREHGGEYIDRLP